MSKEKIKALKKKYKKRIETINENMEEMLKLKDLYEYTRLADHEKIYLVVIEDLEVLLK